MIRSTVFLLEIGSSTVKVVKVKISNFFQDIEFYEGANESKAISAATLSSYIEVINAIKTIPDISEEDTETVYNLVYFVCDDEAKRKIARPE